VYAVANAASPSRAHPWPADREAQCSPLPCSGHLVPCDHPLPPPLWSSTTNRPSRM